MKIANLNLFVILILGVSLTINFVTAQSYTIRRIIRQADADDVIPNENDETMVPPNFQTRFIGSGGLLPCPEGMKMHPSGTCRKVVKF